MAKGTNQKLKLVYLLELLYRKTDEENCISMQEIISELESKGIKAERKSIYDDFDTLEYCYGIDIKRENKGKYHIVSRKFELPELKLLIDSVQASKFITSKKSEELIRKIESLASEKQASKMQRQVFLTNRVKAMNETIYYNVFNIYEAIGNNVKIKFQYYKWNEEKKMVPRRNGKIYDISPLALCWEDENYYLIGYDDAEKIIKHYRVDKIKNIVSSDEKRICPNDFDENDIASYSKKIFGMFHGNQEKVKIEFKNDLAGVVIDRFGNDIIMMKSDDEHFIINVDIAISKQFFGWIIGLGDGAKILGPKDVVDKIKEEIVRLVKDYNVNMI